MAEDFTTTTSCCMVKRPLCHHLTVLPQLEACIKHCVPRLAKRSPPHPSSFPPYPLFHLHTLFQSALTF
ncbi:hypothetical protein PC115_g19662, partial [Phytophthora cactorum]